MTTDRRKINLKDPAWLAVIGYIFGALIQWGALQTRLNGLEADMHSLQSDIRAIQTVIMERSK